MSKFLTLALLILLISPALAETVLWKATGTLDSGTGVFLRQDLSPGDPVTIRMTYSDQAERREKSAIPPGLLGPGRQSTSAFRTGLNLSVTVNVGNYSWEANVENGTESATFSFFVKEGTLPLPEEVKANIAAGDGGEFPSFPFALNQSANQLSLAFISSNNTFIDSGITATSFSPEFLTSGSGEISTGVGNKLAFTLEPSSLKVLFEEDETITPVAPVLTTSTDSENFILTWQSDFDFRYRVESSFDLSSDTWDEVETRFGTDAIITRTYPLTSSVLFYRVVALERPPIN